MLPPVFVSHIFKVLSSQSAAIYDPNIKIWKIVYDPLPPPTRETYHKQKKKNEYQLSFAYIRFAYFFAALITNNVIFGSTIDHFTIAVGCHCCYWLVGRLAHKQKVHTFQLIESYYISNKKKKKAQTGGLRYKFESWCQHRLSRNSLDQAD